MKKLPKKKKNWWGLTSYNVSPSCLRGAIRVVDTPPSKCFFFGVNSTIKVLHYIKKSSLRGRKVYFTSPLINFLKSQKLKYGLIIGYNYGILASVRLEIGKVGPLVSTRKLGLCISFVAVIMHANQAPRP